MSVQIASGAQSCVPIAHSSILNAPVLPPAPPTLTLLTAPPPLPPLLLDDDALLLCAAPPLPCPVSLEPPQPTPHATMAKASPELAFRFPIFRMSLTYLTAATRVGASAKPSPTAFCPSSPEPQHTSAPSPRTPHACA